jgi:hypothetical protein
LPNCHNGSVERRQHGWIASDRPNRHCCSEGFEIGCDNGDSSGRESELMGHTGHWFGKVTRSPLTIQSPTKMVNRVHHARKSFGHFGLI